MRTISRKFFAIGLLLALLVCSTGRAIPVSALAWPDPPDPFINAEYAPVYDTQIYQLEDFMRENLTPAQGDVFWIMMGLYVAAQAGMSDYQLSDPYGTQDGILNWLKSCGIQLYNSLIGMGAIGPDPLTGIDYRPFIKGAADIAMGAAVKASTYTDVADFVNDVDVQEKYLVPFMPDIQTALNYVFQRDGGLYNWQFDVGEFVSNMVYNQTAILPTSSYWSLFETLDPPIIRINKSQYVDTEKNIVFSDSFFGTYNNILFNTTTGTLQLYSDDGSLAPSNHPLTGRYLSYYTVEGYGFWTRFDNVAFQTGFVYSPQSTWQELAQYYVDNTQVFTNNNLKFFINDFVKHYYHGPSWNTKDEIFHTTDLDLDENSLPYYQQIGNNYLLDIKGILDALLNETDLTNVILNNLYDLEAVIVQDPVLIRVANEILEEIQTNNPPLPVNLNDIADYTDNSYMDRVKEEAKRGGNALAALVAFWHNCDAELVYVLFGAGITVLVGAFIGKWGHS